MNRFQRNSVTDSWWNSVSNSDTFCTAEDSVLVWLVVFWIGFIQERHIGVIYSNPIGQRHGLPHGSHIAQCRCVFQSCTVVYLLPFIFSVCRTVWFGRFQRLRTKILHNNISKKSRIHKKFVKLQHKVGRIFVRGENFRKFQSNTKDFQRDAYVYLCQPFVFALYFRKFSSRTKIHRTLCCNNTNFLWILDFLDILLCIFFVRRRLNRSNQTVLHT